MRRLPLADALRVKTPCTVGWGSLARETEHTRHCAACAKSVVDVSKLTRREAEALVAARDRGAAVCVHLRVRQDDGAILLADGHAHPGDDGPSLASRARGVVTAASALALAACGATPEAKVPELVPVVVAPLPPPPAAPPPLAEVPSTPPQAPPAEGPSVEVPAPPPVVKPSKTSKTNAANVPTPKTGKPPVVYVDVDGGI